MRAVAEAGRAPTLHDVARRAGVHPATVSRALSRPSMVAPATRSAVLDAVDAVGFVPNRSARQLASGRAGAVGVIVPDITNPFFGSILRSIQGDARSDDLGVLIADTDADPAEERRAIATLGRQVDGLVVITPVTDLSSAPVPVVQLNRQSRRAPSVVVDQQVIVGTAVDHLAALGHRHVAVVRGPAAYWSAAQRDRALERLERPASGTVVRIDHIDPAPATFAAGLDVFDRVRATGASAVVAFNDLQAAGLLLAAHDAGLSVPDDLSIIGSDGLDLAAMTAPPLTTVAAPLDQLGRTALRRLRELLGGEDPTRRTTLAPHLVVRASTGPPSHPHRRRTR